MSEETKNIHNLSIPFYKNSKPGDNESVLVIMTTENNSWFEGHFVEYSGKVFLRKEDATKKKRVTSWNNIVPLNKEIIAKVDDIEFSNDIVKVSITYMDEEQETILENFKKNKKLISIIKSVAFQLGENIDTIWSSIIYKIDEKRKEDYEIEDMPPLLQYCINEIEIFKEIFKDNVMFKKLEDTLNKFIEEKPFKIISTIGIISYDGVQNTKNLIENALNNIPYKYSLTYSYYKKNKTDQKSFPAYIFETSSEDTKNDDHEKFISFLETQAINYGTNTLVRPFDKCKKMLH